MHLSAERFMLWGDDGVFLKSEVKTYVMTPIKSTPNSPSFFSSHP